MHLTLASSSPTRRRLLSDLGLVFDVCSPDVDEARIKSEYASESPEELVQRISTAKGELVSSNTEGLVIAADQVADLDGEILDKCLTLDEARTSLQKLSGKTHRLITASCIYQDGQCLASDVTFITMPMRILSDQEIDAYIHLDKPLGSVGAYFYELNGRSLFRHESDALDVIQGLNCMFIKDYLRKFSKLNHLIDHD